MEAFYAIIWSFVLAAFVGMERQLSKKPVGFAPYIFVTVLSTSLSIASEIAFPGNYQSILNGIITGIGFLGAGALIKYHEKVFGFTTAASVWAMAALGIVIAISDDVVFILLTYAVVWATLIADRLIERRGLGRHQKSVTIQLSSTAESEATKLKDIIRKYRDSNIEAVEVNFDRKVMTYKFYVPEGINSSELLSAFLDFRHIKKITME